MGVQQLSHEPLDAGSTLACTVRRDDPRSGHAKGVGAQSRWGDVPSFAAMRFGILGRVEVVAEDGHTVDLGGAQPRVVLATLLVARGRVVPTDSILEAVWGNGPPVSAHGSLQTYVSRLRRVLGPHEIVWESPGYRLSVDPDDVDAWRFERLAGEGRTALAQGDAGLARRLLLDAEALWRGPALVEIRDLDAASGVAARLDELRLVAHEVRLAADLLLGRHEVAVGELAELVTAHPYREGLREQHAMALYRSGRQAEALRSIADARRTLGEELGLDLSPPLQALEAAILRHDPSLVLHGRVDVHASPPSAERPDQRSFVGRDAELDVVLAAFADAGRATQMVVIEGEPGIGKTRLAEELAAVAAREGAVVVWGRCYEGSAAPAFWPWLGALRSLVSSVPAARSPTLDRLLAPAAEPTPESSPTSPFDLYASVASALVTAAERATVVVVLDDLQWADEASLDLLGHLAATLEDAPVLVVLTVRELGIGETGHLVDALAAVARHRSSRRFRLRGLRDAAIAELLDMVTRGRATPHVAEIVTDRADGNPFYAIELARLFDDAAGSPGPPREPPDDLVPGSVRDVVRQRLARLPAATRQLLEVAAIIGREIEWPLLARATAGDGAAGDLEALEPALRHHMLVDVPDRPGVYRFSHALVREVLSGDVPSVRRARIHLRVADAIAGHGLGRDDDAEIIAEHRFAASPVGAGSQTAAALERAAAVAIRRSAYTVAEDLLERAVATRASDSGSPDPLAAELETVVSLFFVQRIVRGHQAAVEGPTMQRAKALATQVGRVDVLARLLWAEWVGVDKAGDRRRSAELTSALQALAESSPDPLVQGLALHATGVGLWHGGELRRAAEVLDRAAELNRDAVATDATNRIETVTAPLRPTAWPQGHPVVPFVHMLVGDRPDPLAAYDLMTPVERQPFDRTVVRMFAGFGALATGELGRAAEHARRGIEADPEAEFSYWGFGCQLCLAAALVASGETDEGLQRLEDAMPRYLETGTRIFLSLVHARVAQGLARVGRGDDAAAALTEADAARDAYGERWIEPITTAVRAELRCLRDGPSLDVAHEFDAAYDLALRHGARAIADDIARTAAALGLPAAVPQERRI